MGLSPTHCRGTKDSAPAWIRCTVRSKGFRVKRSLLIVDDDADQLLILSRWFTRQGYRVVTANHPRQALVAAGAGHFQVAVVDASLPEIDGIELMRRLKLSQSDLQVIILSGYDFDVYDSPAQLAKADCAFACLVKPCSLQVLELTIENAFHSAASDGQDGQEFDAQTELRLSDLVGA